MLWIDILLAMQRPPLDVFAQRSQLITWWISVAVRAFSVRLIMSGKLLLSWRFDATSSSCIDASILLMKELKTLLWCFVFCLSKNISKDELHWIQFFSSLTVKRKRQERDASSHLQPSISRIVNARVLFWSKFSCKSWYICFMLLCSCFYQTFLFRYTTKLLQRILFVIFFSIYKRTDQANGFNFSIN